MKSRISLYLNSVAEDWFRNLILLLVSALVAFVGFYEYSIWEEYNKVFKYSKAINIDHSIVYYTNLSREEFYGDGVESALRISEDYFNRLYNISGVNNVRFFPNGTSIRSNGLDINITNYCDFYGSEFPFELVEGRYPMAPNEVVAYSKVAGTVHVGDTYSFVKTYKAIPWEYGEGYYLTGTMDYLDYPKRDYNCEVKVVGILSPSSFLINGGQRYFPDILTQLFSSAEVTSFTTNEDCYFYCSELLSEDGCSICLYNDSCIVIDVNDDVPLNDVMKSICEEFNTDGNEFVTYDSMKSEYENAYNYIAIDILKYLVILVSLSFGIIISAFVLRIQNRKKELATYYLYGSTWNNCILFSILLYLPSLIIGVICGSVLFKTWGNIIFADVNISLVTPVSVFILIVFYVVLAGIFVFPFYWISYKKSPVELMREL